MDFKVLNQPFMCFYALWLVILCVFRFYALTRFYSYAVMLSLFYAVLCHMDNFEKACGVGEGRMPPSAQRMCDKKMGETKKFALQLFCGASYLGLWFIFCRCIFKHIEIVESVLYFIYWLS